MAPNHQRPIHIRAMRPDELGMGIRWAADEGWNPGLHDAASFHCADPQGFLLAERDGEAIGMVSAVRYGANFGFIGFYIVRPTHRGRGHGLALWQAAMERLSGRLIGLDGVVAQQANYRKSGFVLAYNNMRMQGPARPMGPAHPGIVALEAVELQHVLRYDTELFPGERTRFITQWIRQTGSIALGFIQGGELSGYGVIRPCQVGYKIGPLFANDADIAHHLLNALTSHVPTGAQIQLDIAAGHDAARALAAQWQLQPVFETARMYTGAAPALDLQRQFGITTFELG